MCEPARPRWLTPSSPHSSSPKSPLGKNCLSCSATPSHSGPTLSAHLAVVASMRTAVAANKAIDAPTTAKENTATATHLRPPRRAPSTPRLAAKSESYTVPNPRSRRREPTNLADWKPRGSCDFRQSRCAWSKTIKSASSRSVSEPSTSGIATASAWKNVADSYCRFREFHSAHHRSSSRSNVVRTSLPWHRFGTKCSTHAPTTLRASNARMMRTTDAGVVGAPDITPSSCVRISTHSDTNSLCS
mmetsp:Transcript_5623/g.20130  ORF Transcript_5623/g.20130 Transcript_5623/m.20130 type:complete len:245 (+) Transcript_5623:1390-2124(+)